MPPDKLPKPSVTPRREPTQERAQKTIDTIFQTTAQIVEQDGEAALTTNKIAAKAGFSVGTLYQYFPTKEAILLAMIARERRRVLDQLASTLQNAEQTAFDLHRLVSDLIHILVEAFATGRSLRLAMIRLAWQRDHHEAITQGLREASEVIALHLARAVAMPNGMRLRTSPATLFVVTRGVMGAIRSASLEKSALLGSPEFEAALVRLALAMLTDDEKSL